MSLEKKIVSEMKSAMKNKDQAGLRALRSIKSAILMAKTEKGASKELNDAQEVKLLQKLAKQRKDSIELFEKEGREDLAKKEEEELEVIEKFLPELMSEEEIEAAVKSLIEEVNAQGMQDMGKVMGRASKEFAGKADLGIVSEKVKEQLA